VTDGVIYVATGERHVAEALVSARSLKTHMPDLPVTLYTDRMLAAADVDDVVAFGGDGYLSRIPILEMSPYERTLFLDSDTYVCGDLAELFALLDEFDVALAHAPSRAIYEVEGIPESFPEFNAGVILYGRSDGVKAAFRDWAGRFARFQEQRDRGEIRWLRPEGKRIYKHDQGALRAALYKSGLRIATLPPEYNCRFTEPGFVDGPAKILHGRGVDLAGVAAALNASTARRGYELRAGKLELVRYREASSTFSLENTLYTLRRRGLRWTLRAAVRQLRTAMSRLYKESTIDS
jgi:hypothetical protein